MHVETDIMNLIYTCRVVIGGCYTCNIWVWLVHPDVRAEFVMNVVDVIHSPSKMFVMGMKFP